MVVMAISVVGDTPEFQASSKFELLASGEML